jgi:hypothetical protein
LIVVLSACVDDNKCQVKNYPVGGAPVASEQLRDPSNGQCETFNPYPNPPPCDPACGPCPGYAGPAQAAMPDWGVCNGPCASNNEVQCLASPTCHAVYLDEGAAPQAFWGCWDLPPSGGITGVCDGLDAQTCSEHTDCTSLYSTTTNVYESCHAEPTPAACSTLTTEAACKLRSDCDPIYIGMNCTCDPSGCTCATETYDHCTTH